MIEYMKGYTPEELKFNFSLSELREAAKELEIKGYYKMNKIILSLNIEWILEGYDDTNLQGN